MERGHPLESIRKYELPAAYTYIEMKLDVIAEQKKARDTPGGDRRRLSHSDLLKIRQKRR